MFGKGVHAPLLTTLPVQSQPAELVIALGLLSGMQISWDPVYDVGGLKHTGEETSRSSSPANSPSAASSSASNARANVSTSAVDGEPKRSSSCSSNHDGDMMHASSEEHILFLQRNIATRF